MNTGIKLFDVVALTVDVPAKALLRGQVGTIVEALEPGAWEVEFADEDGHAYAELALPGDQLMVLHYRLEPVA